MHGEGKSSSASGGNRPTWFDLSADDSDTLVAEGKAGGTGAEKQDAPKGDADAGACPAVEPPVPDRPALQQKIKQCKRVISMLVKEGYEEGDEEFDGAKRRLARLTQQLEDKEGNSAQATGSALDRAERQLKKANAAREALDRERAEMEEEHRRNLARLDSKYEQVDERIQLHTKKIEDIKAALGGGRKVPSQVAKNVAAATEILAAVGPSITEVLALLKPDPRYQNEQGTLDNLGAQLGRVYSHLVDTTNAIQGAAEEDTSDEESSEFDDDLDDDDDGDGMEVTLHGQQEGDAAEESQHAVQSNSTCGNGPHPTPCERVHQPTPQTEAPAVGGGGAPMQAATMVQDEAAKGGTEATDEGSRSNDGPSAKKHKTVSRDGKGRSSGRQPGTVGGATAPMLAAAQDASCTVRDGPHTTGGTEGGNEQRGDSRSPFHVLGFLNNWRMA